MTSLTGKRILIVEDEALVALMVEDILAEYGAIIIGSKRTVEDGLALAKTADIDAAVLDVNVRGHRIDPVVDVLAARGIPFLLATGYGKVELPNGQNAICIEKPYTPENLAKGLATVLQQNADAIVKNGPLPVPRTPG
jgi:DNA-binding response OmpR family regulator